MDFNDTGLNIPETLDTLRAQQAQLLSRKRPVQMFPLGLRELPLPQGMSRHQNDRGVFHFWQDSLTADAIDKLSAEGRENEILNLGPYNKSDVAERLARGEPLVAVAEFDLNGVEVRTAAGTPSTAPEQVAYFEATKDAGNKVEIFDMAQLLMRRLS